MLWDVSRAGSVPRQKQQSQTLPPAMQMATSLPQMGCSHFVGLHADTLCPSHGAESSEVDRDLLVVLLAALLAWCRRVGRSSQHSPEPPLQPNLAFALPFLHFLLCFPSLRCEM